MNSKIEKKYKNIYQDIEFERAELFHAINQNLPIKDVLYPGCNIHVTPSFFFQHVIYIDLTDNAASFFAEKEQVKELINKNKTYKPSPYFQFIKQDFTKPLPLKESGFDLLLSLFAGGITSACTKYIKKGGYVLTNNHQNDAKDALNHPLLAPVAILSSSKKGYVFLQATKEDFCKQMKKSNRKLLNQNPIGGLHYKEKEIFYLFQKRKD